jgi:hypothetical protein
MIGANADEGLASVNRIGTTLNKGGPSLTSDRLRCCTTVASDAPTFFFSRHDPIGWGERSFGILHRVVDLDATLHPAGDRTETVLD